MVETIRVPESWKTEAQSQKRHIYTKTGIVQDESLNVARDDRDGSWHVWTERTGLFAPEDQDTISVMDSKTQALRRAAEYMRNNN